MATVLEAAAEAEMLVLMAMKTETEAAAETWASLVVVDSVASCRFGFLYQTMVMMFVGVVLFGPTVLSVLFLP